MKFNWGTGIAIFYTVFAISMITMVIKSTGYDHSLVANNYYEEDLAYQTTYNKMQNSLSLKQPTIINFDAANNLVNVQFSDNLKPEGTITFYRPNNEKLDIEVPIKTDGSNLMSISTAQMPAGVWKIKADWTSEGKAYLDIKDFRKQL
jgi:nitrogen fixation protein FixH